MLSNLEDFSAGDVVAREAMEPLDRLACTVTDAFVAGVKDAYDACEIHDAYLRIVEFESSMSSLYFDALKDPLYSRAAGDPRRRSAQSALLYIATRFFTTVAPVLSFTAEEAWQHLPAWRRTQTRERLRQFLRRQPLASGGRKRPRALASAARVARPRCCIGATARLRSAGAPYRAASDIQTPARARRQLARGAGRLAVDAELAAIQRTSSSCCRPMAKNASGAGSTASWARIPAIRISAPTAPASSAPWKAKL